MGMGYWDLTFYMYDTNNYLPLMDRLRLVYRKVWRAVAGRVGYLSQLAGIRTGVTIKGPVDMLDYELETLSRLIEHLCIIAFAAHTERSLHAE